MKTLLSLAVLLGFGVAGALVWNYLRARPGITLHTTRPSNAPYADALCSGFQFALEETHGRVGPLRLRSSLSVGGPDDACTFLIGPNILLIPLPSLKFLGSNYRIMAGPEELVEAAAAWAAREGLKIVRIVTEPDDPQSTRIERALQKVWKGRVAEDPRPMLILHAGESAPFSSAAMTYRELKASGFKGRFLVFDAHPEVSCVDAPGQPEDGMLLVTPIFPPPADFIPLYRAYAHKDPGPHVYGGYLAGKAALDLIARARSSSPEDLLSAASGIRPHPPALYVARGGRFHFVELLSFPAR